MGLLAGGGRKESWVPPDVGSAQALHRARYGVPLPTRTPTAPPSRRTSALLSSPPRGRLTGKSDGGGDGGSCRGAVDENWALSSHRFWSGSSAVVHCTDWAALAFPSPPLSSPWVASSFIEGGRNRGGRNLKGLRPEPIAQALHSSPQSGRPHWETNEVRGGGSCRGRSMRIGPSLHIGSGQAHRAVVGL